MAEPRDPVVEARLARLAARGRVAKPYPPAASSPPPPTVPVARRPHPAEGARLAVGVLSAATALGLVAGLAWGSRDSAAAQPSANPPVVVVPDSSASGSAPTVTPSNPLPLPQLPAPSTNSGGS